MFRKLVLWDYYIGIACIQIGDISRVVANGIRWKQGVNGHCLLYEAVV